MRSLGFILSSDPTAAQVAILPDNGTIPPGEEWRYASIAQGNQNAIAKATNAAAQWIPGIENRNLIIMALAATVLIVSMKGRR